MSHVFHFFLPDAQPGARGTVRRVCEQDAKRMERVLRLRPGDEVEVADGDGRIWMARVVGGGEVELIESLVEPRPAPALVVRLALTGPRSDTAIEKLVELGVEDISPLETAAIKREPRTVRWQRIAEAAACQAKRPRIPRIGAVRGARRRAGSRVRSCCPTSSRTARWTPRSPAPRSRSRC